MNFDIIALGSLATAIMAIAAISFAIFRLMFNSHTRNADVAKAKQDADNQARFQALWSKPNQGLENTSIG